MFAAHRGAADVAGSDRKSAVYRKVQEEVKAGRGPTIERMVELGWVSRSGFIKLMNPVRIGTWNYAMRFRRLLWNGPAMVVLGSP